jgi:hypothetical protein
MSEGASQVSGSQHPCSAEPRLLIGLREWEAEKPGMTVTETIATVVLRTMNDRLLSKKGPRPSQQCASGLNVNKTLVVML